ncbi:hypothetical protein PpBr36_04014 [Pyricularia pennisetigena]|uniref:hypothetical protein n=1 Tax=Pyricularia pennisetigena TaxID=1578925 RepID=UPI0011504894|nr:hypothetical protein PpBr36_04014 [Pyricularia pennisetigena]TLS26979.1 hypothetical protein PpBr36_04014 [Pyricularia pennisetigena]
MIILRLAVIVAVAAQVCSAVRPSFMTPRLYAHHQAKTVVAAAEGRYPARSISVPVDHFHNDKSYEPHSNDTFQLRYWFDASHYRDGGPVIVLLGGETTGAERLRFMEKGILYRLARATGGMAVVLEHRYYGASFPTPNLTTESLRFLTTDQALADTAFFAQNVVFSGFEAKNLTSHTTPYFAYGGSYAGAFAAFARKLYPDVFWGAISSSGVPLAVIDYWEYCEAQRKFAPPECVAVTQKLTNVLDTIAQNGNFEDMKQLKEVFGLSNLTNRHDFANVLSSGIMGWQSLNWDPKVSDNSTYEYCANVSSSTIMYPGTRALRNQVRDLLVLGGYEDANDLETLTPQVLNYIGWINATVINDCNDMGATQDECFSLVKPDAWQDDDLSTWSWRSWQYQPTSYLLDPAHTDINLQNPVTKRWGYFITGSGYPENELPLMSRLIDLPYLTLQCKYTFNITALPDVDHINKLGGLNFSYPRVAFVDGEADPWLYAGVHAPEAPKRNSTDMEPFMLIKGGVHHWDENGLWDNETTTELPPREILDVQAQEVQMIQRWLGEWRKTRNVLERLQFRYTLEGAMNVM